LHIAQPILSGTYLPCFIFFLEGDTFVGNTDEGIITLSGDLIQIEFNPILMSPSILGQPSAE
jgi:hypothetical protein